MKYNISAFTGTNLQIAQEPEIGVEAVVKVAYSPFGTVALVEQDAADSGATASVSNAYSIPVAGVDLAIMCDNAMLSDVALVITLNVVDEDDAATTAVATFTRPTWSGNTSYNQPQGMALDLVPATAADKKIKSVTSVASISGGVEGNTFRIVALPDTNDWYEVGCPVDKNTTLPIPEPTPINCRFNGARYVKPGQSPPGNLTVSAHHVSYADGLGRLLGHKVSAMLEIRKRDRVVTDRIVIGGWQPQPQSDRGGGNDTVESNAEGLFEQFATFSPTT